jgi:hypothetical protein
MKKALLILLALSIVGAAAFADVKISAFTVTGFKAETASVAGVSNNRMIGYDYFRGFNSLAVLGFSYAGSDPNYGYDARLLYIPNLGLTPTMDLSQVWVKMFDGMLKLTMGQVIPNSFATPEMEWGDSQFNGAGINLTAMPIEGLEVAYQIAVPVDGTNPVISDAFANSKIGASYSMKGLFDIKGAYLLNKADKASDAYAGFSLTAVPGLGAWVELLMVDIGSTVTGETDIYVEANYAIMEGLVAGAAFEYNMIASDSALSNFVVEPYVSYTLVEKVVLTGGADFGTGNFGWYGLQTGGVTVTKDGFMWDVFARVDFASPVGNIRVKVQYAAPDNKLDNASDMYVYAGFKWAL